MSYSAATYPAFLRHSRLHFSSSLFRHPLHILIALVPLTRLFVFCISAFPGSIQKHWTFNLNHCRHVCKYARITDIKICIIVTYEENWPYPDYFSAAQSPFQIHEYVLHCSLLTLPNCCTSSLGPQTLFVHSTSSLVISLLPPQGNFQGGLSPHDYFQL